MSYGQFVYRRGSGIYVARLTVPSQFQGRLGRREIHVSTGQRSRLDALSTASAIAQCWRSVYSDFSRLDALKVVEGSPLLIGAGVIFLVDAAGALGMEPEALAIELVNRRSALMANATGWSAVDVADLSHVDRENGIYLWDCLQAEGVPCSIYGLVTLLDAHWKVLDFVSGARVAAWHILVHARQSAGDVFVIPNTAWLAFSDLLVRKADVEALRVSAAAAITAAKVSSSSSAAAATSLLPSAASPQGMRDLRTAATSTPVQVKAEPSIARASLPVHSTSPGDASDQEVATNSSAGEIGGRHSAMCVTALIDAFIRAKSTPEVGTARASWKPDEALRTRQKLRCFPEFMGDLTMADLELMPEAEDIIRKYVTLLMTLPTGPDLSKARSANPTYTATQLALWRKKQGAAAMSARTAQNYKFKLAECFKWGVARTYLRANPAAGVRGDGREAQSRPDQDRSTFTEVELGKIFGAHWFRCGRGRDTSLGKPGKHYRPFYYWIPLLALHCGGRANEIGQLYLTDICVSEGGTSYIAFQLNQSDKIDADDDDNPQDTAGSLDKSLKTVSSARAIPIHSTLIKLGFLDYVHALREGGQERLFPELRFDKTKGYGLEARKWFNDRFLGKDLVIPRDGKKTLHSLRHHFAGVVERSGAPARIQSQLLGHERGETLAQRRYTGDEEADYLCQYIEKLEFTLPEICGFDVADGLRAVEVALALKRRNQRAVDERA